MAVPEASITPWLLVTLLIPRLLRIAWPTAWIEDDFYMEAAWMVSVGMRPYLDFVHPHMPLLEWIAGAWVHVLGASHLTIEILNESAIYITSVLVFALGTRILSRQTAWCAAILYATSSLVFRYHLYERECFVAPLVAVAAMTILDDSASRIRRIAIVAIALACATLVKLTAGIAVIPILAYAAIVRRRWIDTVAIAAAISVTLGAFTLLCWLLYGNEFLFQTFVFHLLKGRDLMALPWLYPLAVLDLQIPMFVLGCAAIAMQWVRARRGIGLIFSLVGAYWIFFGILSPTSWAHNYLEALPFITIVGGAGVTSTVDALFRLFQSTANRGQFLVRAGLAIGTIAICLVWLSPLENENSMRGSTYGFGFISRTEISAISAALAQSSRLGDEVIAPSFICFEANRRELVRFPETYGVWRYARDLYDTQGFAAARRATAPKGFFDLIIETAHYWRDDMETAIKSGKVSAVILDSPIQLLPLVIPQRLGSDFDKTMSEAGLRPVGRTDDFMLWQRAP